MSVVGVVVIDCTDTGASPPTSTLPTLIFRLARRGATTGGGRGGIPRETDMEPSVRARARSAMIEPRADQGRPSTGPSPTTARRRTCASSSRGCGTRRPAAREDLVSAARAPPRRGAGRRAAGGVRPHGGARPPCGARAPGRSTASARRRSRPGTPRRRATAQLQAVEARREAVDRRLAQLGDTAARREAATEAHAHRGAAPARVRRPAAGLDAVLDELAGGEGGGGRPGGGARGRHQGRDRARRRPRELGSADSWSAYDTWFGGGLVSSAIKHDRIDGAGRLIAAGPGRPRRPGPRARRRRGRRRAAGRPRHLPHGAHLRRVVRQHLQRPVGALEHQGQPGARRHGRRRRCARRCSG